MHLFDEVRLFAEDHGLLPRKFRALMAQAHVRLHRMADAWIARRERARQIQDLYRFSDRELWDIGLTRSDIDAIANGHFRRD